MGMTPRSVLANQRPTREMEKVRQKPIHYGHSCKRRIDYYLSYSEGSRNCELLDCIYTCGWISGYLYEGKVGCIAVAFSTLLGGGNTVEHRFLNSASLTPFFSISSINDLTALRTICSISSPWYSTKKERKKEVSLTQEKCAFQYVQPG